MATIKRIDDRAANVALSSGDFSQGGNGNEYMSTTSRTNRVGATVRVSFTGTKIAIYGTIDSTTLGTAPRSMFSIDGGRGQEFVENQIDRSQYYQQFYVSPDLPPGNHNLLITVTSVPSITASFTFDFADIWVVDLPSSTTSNPLPIITTSPNNNPPSSTSVILQTSVLIVSQTQGISTSSIFQPSPPPSPSGSSTSLGTASAASSASDSSSTSSPPNGSSTSLDSKDSTTSPSSKSSTPGIVGGIVGSVVVILLILLGVFLCLRKRKHAARTMMTFTGTSPVTYSDAITRADTAVTPFVGNQRDPLSTDLMASSRSELLNSNRSEYSSSSSGSGSMYASTRGPLTLASGSVSPMRDTMVISPTNKFEEAQMHRRNEYEQPPPRYEL